MELTPLLSVTMALAPELRNVSYVPRCISAFLMPKTVDSAVFNDLQLVINTHGGSLQWTTKAMDGAAARGRLDIMEWLHVNRSEGCSSAAMNVAAANGHLEVVEWLSRNYSSVSRREEALCLAARHGRIDTIKFLRERLPFFSESRAFLAAVRANRVDVARMFLPTPWANEGLDEAAKNGHIEMVKVLLTSLAPYDHMEWAVNDAVRANHIEIVRLLVAQKRCVVSGFTLSRVAAKGQAELVRLLVPRSHPNVIGHAAFSAALKGHETLARFLLGKIAYGDLGPALVTAAKHDQLEAVRQLLSQWDARSSQESTDGYFLMRALEAAIANVNVVMIRLLVERSGSYVMCPLLHMAIARNDTALVLLLASASSSIDIARGAAAAARKGQLEMAMLLLQKCPATDVNFETYVLRRRHKAKRLLVKCETAVVDRLLQMAVEKGLLRLATLLKKYIRYPVKPKLRVKQ